MSDYLLKGAISNAVNFPEHHGRGSAAAHAVGEARRAVGFVRRSAHRDQHQGHPHRVLGRRGDAQHQAADRGSPCRRAAPAALRREHGLRRRSMRRSAASCWRRSPAARMAPSRATSASPSKPTTTSAPLPAPCSPTGVPRIIQVRNIDMEFEVAPRMLFIRNADKPGFIGKFGMLMGEAGLNIATLEPRARHARRRCDLHGGNRRAGVGRGARQDHRPAAGGACEPPGVLGRRRATDISAGSAILLQYCKVTPGRPASHWRHERRYASA